MAQQRISKEFITIDKENSFWVIIENGKIKRKNPTREELGKVSKVVYYNKTNICPICREESERDGNELTDKSILYPGNTRRYINKEGKATDEYICNRHHYTNYQKYDPNSQRNIMKLSRDHRTGNLTYYPQIFADNCQTLTCILFEVKDLNKENDNYNTPIDHSHISKRVSIDIGGKLIDLSGKIPQTKGRVYNPINEYWAATFKNEYNTKKFDILILYCMNKDGKAVERMYIFPKEEVTIRSGITIYKNHSKLYIPWYEKYMVKDEDILKNINDLWQKIINK